MDTCSDCYGTFKLDWVLGLCCRGFTKSWGRQPPGTKKSHALRNHLTDFEKDWSTMYHFISQWLVSITMVSHPVVEQWPSPNSAKVIGIPPSPAAAAALGSLTTSFHCPKQHRAFLHLLRGVFAHARGSDAQTLFHHQGLDAKQRSASDNGKQWLIVIGINHPN